MSSCSSRALTILSTVFGACGLLLVGVAVSTDYWLIMVEGIILQQNQSMEVKMALHSGLWRVCFVAGRKTHSQCCETGAEWWNQLCESRKKIDFTIMTLPWSPSSHQHWQKTTFFHLLGSFACLFPLRIRKWEVRGIRVLHWTWYRAHHWEHRKHSEWVQPLETRYLPCQDLCVPCWELTDKSATLTAIRVIFIY